MSNKIKKTLNSLCASNIENDISYLFFLDENGLYIADIFYIESLNYLIASSSVLDNLTQHLQRFDLTKELYFEKIDLHVYFEDHFVDGSYLDPRVEYNYIFFSEKIYQNDNKNYQKMMKIDKKMADFDDFLYKKSIILNYGYISKFISFDKGCYLGQEVMCRLKMLNTIRKTVDVLDFIDDSVIQILCEYNNAFLVYKKLII